MSDLPIAKQVLEYVFRYRRTMTADDPCADNPCDTCYSVHLPKVRAAVERGEPVHFLILAFPAKSPNHRKVLGELPDMAERVAIEFLQSFCDHIGGFYPPGARVTICSDGHVFSDLVGVRDDAVTAYRDELAKMIVNTGGQSIDLYSLDDAFPGDLTYDEMRERLVAGYALSLEELRAQVRTDDDRRALFNGIHRFLFEDQSVLHPHLSRTRVREDCKELAYHVIRRSDAWSTLVAGEHPGGVRLSIHPQPCHGQKIGFHLAKTRDNWLTPWHGVALDDGTSVTLVKRSEAERLNASLVWRHARPSHFVAPHLLLGKGTS